MQTQVTLDSNKLKQIANASHTAEAVMTHCALRTRLRSFTDIPRTQKELMRAGEKIVDKDYHVFWEQLQAAGAGVIVSSRNGKPPRFEWHYSMKKVAQSALEGKNIKAQRNEPTMVKSAPVAPKLTKPAIPATKLKVVESPKLVFIPLRADFCLEFSVPVDFSKAEAEMISQALKRLAS